MRNGRAFAFAALVACISCILCIAPAIANQYDPPTLSGTMWAWYDASDSSTITQSGGAVSQWNDKSGNGYNLTQSTSSQQPSVISNDVNGLSTIAFTKTSKQTLGNTTVVPPSSETVFVVVKHATSASGGGAWYHAGSTSASSDGLGFGYGSTDFDTTGDNILGLIENVAWLRTTTAATGTGIADLLATNGAESIWWQGASAGSFTSGFTTPFPPSIYVGGYTAQGTHDRYVNDHIAEVVVYSAVLSTANQQLVEGCEAWKWGFQASLASGHPYQTTAPTGCASGATRPSTLMTLGVGYAPLPRCLMLEAA